MTAFPSRLIQQLPPSLTAKALLMTYHQPQRSLASKVKSLLDAAAFSTNPDQLRDAQRDLMNAWNAEADEELQDKLTMTEVRVGQQILALKAAPLADKPTALVSMPIIDMHNAALFLGVTVFGFNHFIAFHRYIFGQCYMNRRHYSLHELMLIDSNPEWLSDYRKSPVQHATSTADWQFRFYWVVEEKVAMAFCNITRDELPKVTYVTSDDISAYSLADLDKIRVAKLKAQQQ
jgi:hypothetical protein